MLIHLRPRAMQRALWPATQRQLLRWTAQGQAHVEDPHGAPMDLATLEACSCCRDLRGCTLVVWATDLAQRFSRLRHGQA